MLTLFVGTLTDYFRAGFADSERPARDEMQPRVEAWRDYISDGLENTQHIRAPLAWSEDAQEAYTHVLTVEALQALRLVLVHGSGCADPPSELPADFAAHPRWVEASRNDFAELGAFDQLLVPEFWLPNAEFEFTFTCPYPDGHEVQAGSVAALRRQLLEVGRSKLPATAAQRAEWRTDVPQGTRDLMALARYAFSAFDAAADEAARRRLPLLLHW